MKIFNFENFISKLREIKLTQSERNSMRLHISQHMHRHPIGSRSSFFMFRYALVSSLAIILIIGSGGTLTFASQTALPGQKLYSVKLVTEQVKKIMLPNSEAKVTYELSLIDKRFNETNQLITEQKLTTEKESIVIAAIKQHTNDFKAETETLAINNPALALSYNVKLGNTLKTGTHVLLALSDRQPKSSVSPNTLVLAAYATAEKVSAEKKQLESIVASDTNIATIKTAEKRYTETIAALSLLSIKPAKVSSTVTVSTETTVAAKPTTANTLITKTETVPVVKKLIEPLPTATTVSQDTATDLQSLANTLQTTYEAKKYGQVIIICDQIEQQLHEDEKIKEIEKTYNINISPDAETSNSIKTETKVETVTSEKLELLPEMPVSSEKIIPVINR